MLDKASYPFRMEPRDYQLENFERFKDRAKFAIFSEPGTGKTKTLLDIVSYRWHRGALTGVLVFSSPKGVHAQWVEEQIPLHVWGNVPYRAAFWNGRKAPIWIEHNDGDDLRIFSTNIDSLNSDKAYQLLEKFCHIHRGSLMIVVDESDSIKSFRAKRSKRLRALAFNAQCTQRAIMTGTPIAKDLTDEWAQFYFLDHNIIGHKYKTAFQAQYCIMGGFENRHVIGHRNVEQFKELTKPYIFRATKEQLHLPPKIYDTVAFDLTTEQKRMIKEIRTTCMAALESGGDPYVLASTAVTALMRMQQISCGFAVMTYPDRPGITDYAPIENPRMDALKEILAQYGDHKVIIWCRFRHDVEQVQIAFNKMEPTRVIAPATPFYGAQSDAQRAESKRRFIEDESIRYLVATPDAAGRGLDGLQHVCSRAIYYSNSFNAIARWQSEDRIHRIGQEATASYIDLVARGSPDRHILANLKAKKSLSELVLDDIKAIIKGDDESG